MSSSKLTQEERRVHQQANARRYRERHPERVRKSTQNWRRANAEYVQARFRRWREENPGKMAAARRNWVANNRERHRATRNKWQAANSEKINAQRRERYQRRAETLRKRLNQERANRKQELVQMLGGRCVDCFQVPHLAAFEFDHIGPKTAPVSSLLSRASLWKRAVIEAQQCELVCANCHRIRTANRSGKV